MTVYLHTGGIKLELPRYAKRISLGILQDMDIGIAQLEFVNFNWVTRLLYVKSADNPKPDFLARVKATGVRVLALPEHAAALLDPVDVIRVGDVESDPQ